MNADLAAWFDECLASYHYRNRIKWTPDQKRKAIGLMLRANPHRSDRSIAEQTGFSRELIASVRGRLPKPGHRIGLDGKRYRRTATAGEANQGISPRP